MPKHPPESHFDRAHIAAGGTIHNAVTVHRILTAMLGNLFFVIANHDDDQAARTTADALITTYEGFRPVFVVLLADVHLDALDAGVELNLPVLDAQRRYQPATSAIRVDNRTQVELTTEYGKFLSEVVTTGDLRAGDIYTCGTPRLGSNKPDLMAYRAKADYDPTTGEIRHHIVDPGQIPADDERTGALDGGPDTLVHRVVDRAAFLEAAGLTDLVPA